LNADGEIPIDGVPPAPGVLVAVAVPVAVAVGQAPEHAVIVTLPPSTDATWIGFASGVTSVT